MRAASWIGCSFMPSGGCGGHRREGEAVQESMNRRCGAAMFRISQFMQEIAASDAGRADAQAARPGGDLEPDPPLQPHLQALLFDFGRQGLSRRAVHRRGVHV
jgi:hypothetical protein